MSLIDRMKTDCVLMSEEIVSDGYGADTRTYSDAMTFSGAITYNDSIEAKIAEMSGVRSLYTITTNRDVILKYHDIVKRVCDGKIFRVTSDGEDKYSPLCSSLDIRQVSAEEWRIDNG